MKVEHERFGMRLDHSGANSLTTEKSKPGSVSSRMEELPLGRAVVDTRQYDRLQIMRLYSGIIDKTFGLYGSVSGLDDHELNRQAGTVIALSEARELYARENSLVSATIAGGGMSPERAPRDGVAWSGSSGARTRHGDPLPAPRRRAAVRRHPGERGLLATAGRRRPARRPRPPSPGHRPPNSGPRTTARSTASSTTWSPPPADPHHRRDHARGHRDPAPAGPGRWGGADRHRGAGAAPGCGSPAPSSAASPRWPPALHSPSTGCPTWSPGCAGASRSTSPRRRRRWRTATTRSARSATPSTRCSAPRCSSAVDEAEPAPRAQRGLPQHRPAQPDACCTASSPCWTGWSAGPTDPDELEDLFRVDHLATRMRRHAEDLVILAGAAPGRGWRNPVP